MSNVTCPVRLVAGQAETRLFLSGSVNLIVADRLHGLACEALARGLDVLVDCSHAEHIDVSAAQVLIALARGLRGQGRCLTLGSVPGPVAELLAVSGLDALLARAGAPLGEPGSTEEAASS